MTRTSLRSLSTFALLALGSNMLRLRVTNAFGLSASTTTSVTLSPPVAQAVPEPSSLVLLTIGGCFTAVGTLRRRWRETATEN